MSNASSVFGLRGFGKIFVAVALCLTAVAGLDRTEAKAGTPDRASAAALTEARAMATDVSARRRRYARRYRDEAAARAFLGFAAGTIGAVIAQQRRDDYYRQQYYYGGTPYYGRRYYGGPGYYSPGYYGPGYYGQGYYSGY